MIVLWKGARLGACLVALGACSTTSSAVDAGDAGGTPNNILKCGNGTLTGVARATDVITIGPIANATLSAPGCTTAISDDRGYVQVAIDPGVVLKLSATADNYVNAYAEITVLKGGFNETGADYKKSDSANLIPQLSTSNGYLFVGVGGDGSDGGPCSSGTGAAVSVDGHAELKPSYLSDQKTIDPNGTATEGFGTLFGPMPPGTYSVTATKTGCKSAGGGDAYFSYATSTTVVANFVTLLPMRLTP
jgi:hypothetical protein